jgi:hypothetical protein
MRYHRFDRTITLGYIWDDIFILFIVCWFKVSSA